METQLHVPENKLKNLTEERIILDCHTRVSSAIGDHVEEVVQKIIAASNKLMKDNETKFAENKKRLEVVKNEVQTNIHVVNSVFQTAKLLLERGSNLDKTEMTDIVEIRMDTPILFDHKSKFTTDMGISVV